MDNRSEPTRVFLGLFGSHKRRYAALAGMRPCKNSLFRQKGFQWTRRPLTIWFFIPFFILTGELILDDKYVRVMGSRK
jgi:hypothetical protein